MFFFTRYSNFSTSLFPISCHSLQGELIVDMLIVVVCFYIEPRNIFYSEIYHLSNIDVLTRRCFRVIQKIVFDNLCKGM